MEREALRQRGRGKGSEDKEGSHTMVGRVVRKKASTRPSPFDKLGRR